MNETGKYIVSGVKNCPGSKIVQGKIYDSDKYLKQVPGPGTYQAKENFNKLNPEETRVIIKKGTEMPKF